MLLAHLTDVHLLESREARSHVHHATMRLTSLGRSLDADLRAKRLAGALDGAKKSGARHLVISGDLTEMGTVAQFEAFAAILEASGWREDAVTLLPGNHDAYAGDPGAWDRALDGPLARWSKGSARAAGVTLIDRGELAIVAVDTSITQSFARSGGALRNGALECVARFAADRAFTDRPLVVALHHPPYPYQVPILRAIDSLEGGAALLDCMMHASSVHAIFGHLHRDDDRPVAPGGEARLFCARATMKGGAVVRLYEARGSRLVACGTAPT